SCDFLLCADADRALQTDRRVSAEGPTMKAISATVRHEVNRMDAENREREDVVPRRSPGTTGASRKERGCHDASAPGGRLRAATVAAAAVARGSQERHPGESGQRAPRP